MAGLVPAISCLFLVFSRGEIAGFGSACALDHLSERGDVAVPAALFCALRNTG